MGTVRNGCGGVRVEVRVGADGGSGRMMMMMMLMMVSRVMTR